MACLCCISDAEVENDKYGRFTEPFHVSLKDAPCTDPCCCLGSLIFWPCALYKLRTNVIDHDMSQYACCQGYYVQCTKSIDSQTPNCPECCLMMEATCCPSCSVSASRMLVQDQYEIHSDPYDRRLIRCSNMLQWLSLALDCAAMIDPECADCARAVDCFSEITYCTIQSCMVVQVTYELKHRRGELGGSVQNPKNQGYAKVAHAEDVPMAKMDRD